ncbi:MAG: nitrogen regulation protein NR(II) [Halofilum sp. (in: g-proteobacteria)]|nr:nitrogen regulation protein NR(II) [Halofilum sp. (in: g-proteobacteria)]
MSVPAPDPRADQAPAELLEALAVAVVVLDGDTVVRYANAAAEDLLASSRKGLIGQSLWRTAAFGSDWGARLERALAAGEALTAREIVLEVAPAGPTRRVDVHATPWQSDGWGPVLVLELSPLDHHLRIAREERLAAQEQASRSLLRGLAHEIRNPLGGLRGAAQLLEAELPDAGLAEYTRVIVRETERLRDLVDRMMAPATPPQMVPVNIHEVTEHVVSLLQAQAGAGVEIVTDYDPSIPETRGDRDQLVQALLNLGGNALQALDGHGRLTLRTSTRRQHTIGAVPHRLVACVEVIDDGPGVPPALRETLFQPMVSGRADGSGLGLSIAQSLVRRHGGLVECDSVPGETVFRVLLPLPERPHER